VRLDTKRHAAPDVSRALDCLRLTEPHLKLEYPSDAEEHVEEIQRAMENWRPTGKLGYFTYQAEDVWMTKVKAQWDHRSNGTRLADMFGPYVPIFAYFVVPWAEHGHRYPQGFVQALQKVLRRNVPYVAVSENDEGLVGKGEFDVKAYPNILVLSGGGYGNVAVPLFLGRGRNTEEAHASARALFAAQHLRSKASLRPRFVNYVGTIGHAPRHLRERMKEMVMSYSRKNNITEQVVFYKGRAWWEHMVDSKFTLVPRGFGRTAFHLVETIQAGLIPIYIYSDIPWVPYPELFKELGYVTNLTGLPALLDRLRRTPPDEIDAHESTVVKFGESHFTPDALIGHIFDFLLWRNNGGDLRCQQLPPTVRDAEERRGRFDDDEVQRRALFADDGEDRRSLLDLVKTGW